MSKQLLNKTIYIEFVEFCREKKKENKCEK